MGLKYPLREPFWSLIARIEGVVAGVLVGCRAEGETFGFGFLL